MGSGTGFLPKKKKSGFLDGFGLPPKDSNSSQTDPEKSITEYRKSSTIRAQIMNNELV